MDTRDVLRRTLERAEASAREHSAQDRTLRDELTLKIRFGAASLNAASLVTVANLGQSLRGLSPTEMMIVSGFFFVGTIAAGVSLTSQQNEAITNASETFARAQQLDRAISSSEFSPGTDAFEQTGTALDESARLSRQRYSRVNRVAIYAQSTSLWVWVGGVIALATTIIS